MDNTVDVCPICQDDDITCDAVTACGHRACALCALRVAATTRSCWICRRPLGELRVGDETIAVGGSAPPAAESDSVILQASSTDFFPVIFLVDRKVALVSFAAGMMAYSYLLQRLSSTGEPM